MSKKRLFLLINHRLLKKQTKELEQHYGIGTEEILTPPQWIKEFWAAVAPEGDLPLEMLDKIINYLETSTQEGDYLLIQGDYGCVYYLVSWAFKRNRQPIYATTYRSAKEDRVDGKVIIERIFEHCCFRAYQNY